MLIDTHCHINIMVKKDFDAPLPENFKTIAQPIIDAATKAGVTTLINVGTSVIESKNCISLARAFKNCFATIGTHPNDAQENWQEDIKEYKKLLQDPQNKIVGIGEIGLDYHYEYNKQRQYDCFKAQIELALDHNLPIVIHTRDAGQEVLDVLENYKQKKLRGIIHCFSEDLAFANRALELGFVLGIGGPLTYPKNKTLQEVFATVPLEKIVLETDAPFLPPQTIRGQKNSPTSIATIAQYLAGLRNISLPEVAKITSITARELFTLVKD